MSWSFEFTVADKAEAKAKIAERRTATPIHFPEAIASVISDALDAIPDNGAADLSVRTHGHIDAPEHGRNGSLFIEIRQTTKSA